MIEEKPVGLAWSVREFHVSTRINLHTTITDKVVENNKNISNRGQFNDRLKILIEQRFDGKWTRLARDAGLSHGSVTKYLKGTGNPGYTQLGQICEVSGVNANWLILGEGPMLREGIAQNCKHLAAQESTGEETNWWQDLARTLQLRINQLEDEVRQLKIGSTDTDLRFGTADESSDDIPEQERLEDGSVEGDSDAGRD